MAKRISGYFARLEEAKRKFEENQNKPKEENDTQNSEDLSAERLFSEVWSQATPAEVMLEFLWFKKWSGVKLLLDSIQSDLVEQVRLTLKIDLQVLQLYESKSEAMNICQDVNLPILDALSQMMGVCLRNIISPPTKECLLCGKALTKLNHPVNVPIHTTNGPEMATKYMWQCHRCPSTVKMRGIYEGSNRIYYHIGRNSRGDLLRAVQ